MRRESGGDYSNTFSKSRTLKDASQQSTASHTIPKVTGEVGADLQNSPSRNHAVSGLSCRQALSTYIWGNAVCAVHMLQWRVVDDKGNKVKSQEVLEMPKWCIHPFSALLTPAKLLSRRLSTLALFQSCPESKICRGPDQHFVCCRPVLSGVPDDDRFLGSADRLCDSMVCMCGGAA
jgi:hypothetical protein